MSKKRCYGCMTELLEGQVTCPHCGFDLNLYLTKTWREHVLAPGETIGDSVKYTIGKTLGIGGFGITYMGWDNNLERPVAIKEYFPRNVATRNTKVGGPEANHVSSCSAEKEDVDEYKKGLEGFKSEAQLLAKFSEVKGIVPVYASFYYNNTAYMIMKYLPGKSLDKIVKERIGKNPFSEQEILDLMKPVIQALKKIHAQNLIHRDISPQNIVMDEYGDLTLIDFGSTRKSFEKSAAERREYTVSVKEGYAPLEQYNKKGEQGTWTDVYALCATIYYMVTAAQPPGILDRVRQEKDPLMSLGEDGMDMVSNKFASAIMQGMQIDVKDRLQTVDDLERALYGEGDPAEDTGVTDGPSGPVEEVFKVVLDDQNGNVTEHIFFKGETFEYSRYTPASRKGYTFARWANRPDEDPMSDTGLYMYDGSHGDITLYALWTEEESESGFVLSKKLIALIVAFAAVVVIAGIIIGFVLLPSTKSENTGGKDTAEVATEASTESVEEVATEATTEEATTEPPTTEPPATEPPATEAPQPAPAPQEIPASEYQRQANVYKAFFYKGKGAKTFNGHAYAVVAYDDDRVKDAKLNNSFEVWEMFAENMGGHLAVIDSQEENDFIYNDLMAGLDLKSAFFGYTKNNSKKEWRWVNGSSSTYTNWNRRSDFSSQDKDEWIYPQPNNGSTRMDGKKENYAQFYMLTHDGTWNDACSGENSHKFIVEWE